MHLLSLLSPRIGHLQTLQTSLNLVRLGYHLKILGIKGRFKKVGSARLGQVGLQSAEQVKQRESRDMCNIISLRLREDFVLCILTLRL